jgi:methylase of polypeptide subunit release factors
MKFTQELPNEKKITIHYDENVYSPVFSSIDTIVIANRLAIPGMSVLDVGCGSGVIGLSLKLLEPRLSLVLCDIDDNAIKTTRKNARRLKLDVKVKENSPAVMVEEIHDLIVANLPTFTESQMHLATNGPGVAYFAGEDPLRLYRRLFEQAKGKTFYLVCECQTKWQTKFLALAEEMGWKLIIQTDFGFAFQPLIPVGVEPAVGDASVEGAGDAVEQASEHSAP